jgi:hypothetical protein
MFNGIIGSVAMLLFGFCCGGCDGAAQQPAEFDYPPVPPVWIVEDDPKVTIYDRKDLQRDRKPGEIEVDPVLCTT